MRTLKLAIVLPVAQVLIASMLLLWADRTKLDGITGQSYPTYTLPTPAQSYVFSTAPHPNGILFVHASIIPPNGDNSTNYQAVLGINPTTGTQIFSVPLPTNPNQGNAVDETNNIIVAGDGFAYLAYRYGDNDDTNTQHVRVLKVDTSGANSTIDVFDSPGSLPYVFSFNVQNNLISNGGDGVFLSWWTGPDLGDQPHWTRISSAGVADSSGPSIAGMNQVAIAPVVQREDGSFVGVAYVGDESDDFDQLIPYMVAFDASGGVLWSVANEQPQIATYDNGVIGQSGITYDQNGNANGQSVLKATVLPGWLGNALGAAYSADSGALGSIVAPSTIYAETFTAFLGGSASGVGTAIQQILARATKTGLKQLPDLSLPVCWPVPIPVFYPTPTCGNINAIELLTSQSTDFVFQNLIQNFRPVTNGNNLLMNFTGPNNSNAVNVTGSGQVLTITLKGWAGGVPLGFVGENPFQIMTERVDPSAHTISVVTLAGHPLAGWRYFRVYSIGTNDIVIETGGYDQPGPGPGDYAGYYLSRPILSYAWRRYMESMQSFLQAPQGSHLQTSLGDIPLRGTPPFNGPLLSGYWDYYGDFTNYILNNVCQSTVCN